MSIFDLEVPDHAYMFGFLQADGHLHQGPGNKGQLTVELSARDVSLLEAFQRICPYYSSIRYRTRSTNFTSEHNSAVWTVCSLEFREGLQALGLPSGRKSSTVGPPNCAFSERDYLRGLIDADGSLGRTANDLPFVSLTTASELLMRFFCQFTERLTGAERALNRNSRDAIYNVMFTREEAVALIDQLYYPSCLALPRKTEAAGHARSWVRPPNSKKVSRRSWTAEEDHVLLAAADAEEAAGILGRSVQSCSMRRWRLIGPQKARVRFPRTLA